MGVPGSSPGSSSPRSARGYRQQQAANLTAVWRPREEARMAKTHKVGRDSKTGEFIPVKEAERRPDTTTVERVPNPGYGDTDSGKKKGK
jgi:hypothetical protein